jgi:type II secretory pathway pseudopilin PulG
MKVRSVALAALAAIGLLLSGAIEPALAQQREESAEEFNQRAQAERDAYMRQWEAEQAALRAQQSPPTDPAPEGDEPQSNRDRINDSLAEYGLEMGPQTLQVTPEAEGEPQSAATGTELAPTEFDAFDQDPAISPDEIASSSPNNDIANALVLIFFAVCALLYLAPTFIAFRRGHQYRWIIAALNATAGWTGIAWVSVFIWAIWPRNRALAEPLYGDATGIASRDR